MVEKAVEYQRGCAEDAQFPNATVANMNANKVLSEEMGAGVHR